MTGENEKTTMLQGHGINKYYGAKQQRRQVLHDVDIDVRSGECLAVIGGSGSGKTTLTRVLLGLEHAETGEITYFGKPVQGEVAGELLHEEANEQQALSLAMPTVSQAVA